MSPGIFLRIAGWVLGVAVRWEQATSGVGREDLALCGKSVVEGLMVVLLES